MLKIKKNSNKLSLFSSALYKNNSNYDQICVINTGKLFFSER